MNKNGIKIALIFPYLLIAAISCLGTVLAGAASPPAATQPDVIFDPTLDSVTKIAADPEIQGHFTAIVQGWTQPNGSDPLITELAALEKIGKRHSTFYLVRQLLFYLVRNKPGADKPFFQTVIFDVIMRRSSVDQNANAMLEAIAPFAGSEDEDSRFVTDKILGLVEATDHGQKDKISAYYEFIELCQTEHFPFPSGVIRKMFERQPSKALLTCERVYTDNHDREGILLGVHVLDNFVWQKNFDLRFGRMPKVDMESTATLATLASDTQWWPRLYVVEMMRQNAELRDPAILKMLTSDANDLVKSAATRVGSLPVNK